MSTFVIVLYVLSLISFGAAWLRLPSGTTPRFDHFAGGFFFALFAYLVASSVIFN